MVVLKQWKDNTEWFEVSLEDCLEKLEGNYSLTETEKVRVIENFDRAKSLREIKLIYSTLAESFKISPKLKKKITEGFASKTVSTTRASKRKVIAEGNELTNRMKKLAGLI